MKDVIKILAFMIFPFMLYSLILKIFEKVSGETIVQAMIIGSIIFAILIKINMKGGK